MIVASHYFVMFMIFYFANMYIPICSVLQMTPIVILTIQQIHFTAEAYFLFMQEFEYEPSQAFYPL